MPVVVPARFHNISFKRIKFEVQNGIYQIVLNIGLQETVSDWNETVSLHKLTIVNKYIKESFLSLSKFKILPSQSPASLIYISSFILLIEQRLDQTMIVMGILGFFLIFVS